MTITKEEYEDIKRCLTRPDGSWNYKKCAREWDQPIKHVKKAIAGRTFNQWLNDTIRRIQC